MELIKTLDFVFFTVPTSTVYPRRSSSSFMLRRIVYPPRSVYTTLPFSIVPGFSEMLLHADSSKAVAIYRNVDFILWPCLIRGIFYLFVYFKTSI